jgi:hypothetical protein
MLTESHHHTISLSPTFKNRFNIIPTYMLTGLAVGLLFSRSKMLHAFLIPSRWEASD